MLSVQYCCIGRGAPFLVFDNMNSVVSRQWSVVSSIVSRVLPYFSVVVILKPPTVRESFRWRKRKSPLAARPRGYFVPRGEIGSNRISSIIAAIDFLKKFFRKKCDFRQFRARKCFSFRYLHVPSDRGTSLGHGGDNRHPEIIPDELFGSGARFVPSPTLSVYSVYQSRQLTAAR